MTNFHRSATLLGALLLGACASAPIRIHTLQPVAPGAASAGRAPSTEVNSALAGPPIRVDVVHVPPALDRIEVVEDVAPGQIRIRDLDQWSAPLGELARQALTADLIQRLPAGRVLYPRLAKPPGALGVSVDLLAFHAGAADASLQASWLIAATEAPAGTASPAGAGKDTASSERADAKSLRGTALLSTRLLDTNAGGAGATQTAAALSTLLAQLADRIVASLAAGGAP